jgi:hypothetical protein
MDFRENSFLVSTGSYKKTQKHSSKIESVEAKSTKYALGLVILIGVVYAICHYMFGLDLTVK